ncbi:MAG: C45 family autoproteolytic acyltransferase/hydrolase, partial [Candidatus Nanopelagicales bacterium]
GWSGMTCPVVVVRGSARERGRSYGEQARDRIHLSIEAYGRIFAHYAHWDWARVTEEARRYVPAIEAFDASQLAEMEGVAEGAGVALDDILAINVRTEIMFAAKARAFDATLPRFAECSAFAAVGDDGTTYVGENWDWATHAFDTVIRLESYPDDGPAFVTVVEAGLLCKFGMNDAGLGLACNALVSSLDAGEPGVPFHVMLRALIGARTPVEAFEILQRRSRSSSANYLVAHASGLAMDFECEAGDSTHISLIGPDDRGVILHTNHFLAPIRGTDVGLWNFPDSPFRLQRLERALRLSTNHVTPPSWFVDSAQDHAAHPYGICCHPDALLPREEQGATVASTVMNVSHGTMALWDGNPCTAPRIDIDYAKLWSASPAEQALGGGTA